jgi:uncharacterized OB-fold protein/acyl dehydratase
MAEDEYHARLRSFAGREVGPPHRGPDVVNEAMIRHWCEAMGDHNPVYTDPAVARASVHGGLVAPPTMLQAWVMAGLEGPARGGDGSYEQLTETLHEHGFTSVVATNCEQTYVRYLRPGDTVTMRTVIDDVSPEKTTALGTGHFVTTRQDYYDGDDQLVGSMLFRILRFRPPEREVAQPADEQRPPRPRPALTPDNQWWFEALRAGRLQVQRCQSCGAVRHPPGPMCPRCQSLVWEAVDAGPGGRVHSFVRVHHPQVPSFDYPLAVLLVDVDVPGADAPVRMLMNPLDAGATSAIDDRVHVEIRAVDDDLSLPFAVAADLEPAGPPKRSGGGELGRRGEPLGYEPSPGES